MGERTADVLRLGDHAVSTGMSNGFSVNAGVDVVGSEISHFCRE
jgi:hypothetical protein